MMQQKHAEGRVGPICDQLELSDVVAARAEGYARRAEGDHPINRTPSVVAAGAVYLSALIENEKRTQDQVAGAADVGVPAIREAFVEIARHEGVPLKRFDDEEEPEAGLLEAIVDRLVIRDDDPREPHASRSGMKLRAMAVAVVPAIAFLAIATALEAPSEIIWIGSFAALFLGVKAVARPINERIGELEETADTTENGGNADR